MGKFPPLYGPHLSTAGSTLAVDRLSKIRPLIAHLKYYLLLVFITILIFFSSCPLTKRETMQSSETLKRVTFLCILIASCQSQNLDTLTALSNRLSFVTDQLMQRQLFDEERIRSEGGSGIQTVRLNRIGPKNYYAASHTSDRSVSIKVITIMYQNVKILSRASEVGSPTNHLGSGQQQDTGQGS